MRQIYKYLITFAVGIVAAFVIAVCNHIFLANEFVDVVEILIDAFFVPGILLFCFGMLVLATNGGTFDMLTYGMMRFVSLFKKDHNDIKYKTYHEYTLAKHEENRPFGFLVIVGLILIAISVVFILISPNFKDYWDAV